MRLGPCRQRHPVDGDHHPGGITTVAESGNLPVDGYPTLLDEVLGVAP